MAFSKEDEAGVIYENVSAAGVPYMKLTVRGQKFVAYRNKFKKEDKHPDWNVYVDKPRDGRSAPAAQAPVSSDDIAF